MAALFFPGNQPDAAIPDPSIFTIAPDLPFCDTLAAGLVAINQGEAFRLAHITVFLPGRRACLALRGAFLRAAAGQPLLLPRLVPVGGLDEEEPLFAAMATDLLPAMPPLRRQLLLTRLILAGRGAPPPDQAARLAATLARFLDEVQTERLSFDRLATLVPADYAGHWQITLDFLSLLGQIWPSVLAVEESLDPAVWQDLVMRHFLAAWRRQSPSGPVVVAGLSHTSPVLTDLVTAVAALPVSAEGSRGYIVLAGLDRALDDESWDVLDDTHPQAGLKALLAILKVSRQAVADWPASVPSLRVHFDRVRLITEAMRPVATTDRWRALAPLSLQTLAGVDRIDCPTPREEALVIALLLRETLEYEGRTAALITLDRTLARRVAAELERWNVLVDDSAGVPLAHTPPGVFLRLTAAMVTAAFAPLPLLEALKHPLAAAGRAPGDLRRLVRWLEMRLLRGPRPAPGVTGLRAALETVDASDTTAAAADATLHALLAWLETVAAPFTALMQEGKEEDKQHVLAALVRAHVAFSEALATSADQSGSDRLWRHEAGLAAADFVADLLEATDVLPRLLPRFYPALLKAFMESYTVRPSHGRHPRLSIWGPLEARLQYQDLLILGGLNEGVWPPVPEADQWMNHPMRACFGLPLPERRIGLSAHDFVHAFCAPRVVLTRSQRVEGTPTVPSRWLLRLEAVLRATGLKEQAAFLGNTRPWLPWARGLDWPPAFASPSRPAPRPPPAARPRRLSVSEVGLLMRDPYTIYARHVLRLQALPPLDASPDAADYGRLVHKALEIFLKSWPASLPADPEEALLGAGRKAFAAATRRPGVWAFWWPRFVRIARWVAIHERARQQQGIQILPEVVGKLMLTRPGRVESFLLTARADRIELLPDSHLAIIDYKTGQVPSAQEVATGYAPQLPLEAAMAVAGAFPGVPAGQTVAELLYWRLTGMGRGGEERPVGNDIGMLATKALAGMRALIAIFDHPETPYAASYHPLRYSPYQHLARIKEWATSPDADTG